MDIVIATLTQYDNEDFDEELSWEDEDTGEAPDWSTDTFQMQVRADYDSAVVLATATIDTTNAAEGRIRPQLNMGSLDVGEYVYDIVKTSVGKRRVIMIGPYVVEKGVSEL